MAESDPTLFDWAEQQQPEVEYRDAADWPGYRVGNDGSVWTCRKLVSRGRRGNYSVLSNTWTRMNPSRNKKGHLFVTLCDNGIQKRYFVHTLVLLAFVGPRPDGMECCHWDRNPANNNVSNLRWGTSVDNKADMIRHGTIGAKLTEEDVRFIRANAARISPKKLAAMLKVGRSTVRHVIRRDTWGWLE